MILQMCHSCGGGAPVDAHFGPQCTKILTLGRHGDYFSFLGVPRRLNLDAAALEQKFRSLSRQFHPDYFCNAPASERRASLERSSFLNDAYRTLKHPAARIEYLLSLNGFGAAQGGARHATVPPALLEEVFTLNEELDAVREMREAGAPAADVTARLVRARAPIEARRADHDQQVHALSSRWDSLVDSPIGDEAREVLRLLHERMLERNYINNLLATIDREAAAIELQS